MFQGKFAIITPALIAGAVRADLLPRLVVSSALGDFRLCPLCHWVWASDGYFFNLGAKGPSLRGGTSSTYLRASPPRACAVSGCPPRVSQDRNGPQQPHLHADWCRAALVGWFGSNAGSSIASNLDLPGPHRHPGRGGHRRAHVGAHRDVRTIRPTSLAWPRILAGLVVIRRPRRGAGGRGHGPCGHRFCSASA